jgi:hypothetical protein
MRISQVGAPRVCLSSNVACAEALEDPGFIAVSVPLKIEDRADEDGPMVALAQACPGTPLEGKAIEKRASAGWLVFRIPRELCPEGGALVFCASVDQVVLWQQEYRVAWRGRFPVLEPAV